jgi:hypothetical protein
VIVGDRGTTGRPVHINAEGQQVRCLDRAPAGAHSVFVAYGKLFVLREATAYVLDLSTGQALGRVETVSAAPSVAIGPATAEADKAIAKIRTLHSGDAHNSSPHLSLTWQTVQSEQSGAVQGPLTLRDGHR